MESLIVIVCAVIGFVMITGFIFKNSIIVYDFERGLKYNRGKFVGILEPGKYWLFSADAKITKVDIRPRIITVPGQEILSSDGITLKVSAVVRYEIADPDKAVNKVESLLDSFYAIIQLEIRDMIGSMKIDEILEKRMLLNEKLAGLMAGKADELGVKVLMIGIKDIMFPGELKKLFSKVVEAQKEGLAALERSRGETAALRNLANVAKVLEDNPMLLQLRALQSTGNTFVMGVGGTVVPVKDNSKS